MADCIQDRISELLLQFAPAFMQDQENLSELAGAVRWFSVPGGNTLFKRGEPSDAVYVVLSGVLAVTREDGAGAEQVIGRLGPGEIVGEMGCIMGEPRFATVSALRASELLSISWADVGQTAQKNPHILMSICRTLVQRLARSQEPRAPAYRPRTFTLVPRSEGLDLRLFGEHLKNAFASVGNTILATREKCQNMTAGELFRLEVSHDYVVYVAERDSESWSKLCLRQADAILLVADGGSLVREAPEDHLALNPNIPRILLLNWQSGAQPTRTAEWIRVTGASRHFHIRQPSDLGRVARLLAGRGFGLVLSGGGARGAAHLGVARALSENGIHLDVIMGTSIGGLVGAALALEWPYSSLFEKARDFCKSNPLFDITIPRLSLMAGRNVRKSFRRWFGDLQIEDTPIPFSCVSTNLNIGELSIHRTGSLQTWTTASSAVPGVFPPVVVDGIVHVDGGVLNNMPSDLIRVSGAGFVVGVDLTDTAAAADSNISFPWPSGARLNILELLLRVGCIGDEARSAIRRKDCDVLIAPPLSPFGLLSFASFEQIIEIGYRSTLEKLPALTFEMPTDRPEAAVMLLGG
jgi:NTE family protein